MESVRKYFNTWTINITHKSDINKFINDNVTLHDNAKYAKLYELDTKTELFKLNICNNQKLFSTSTIHHLTDSTDNLNKEIVEHKTKIQDDLNKTKDLYNKLLVFYIKKDNYSIVDTIINSSKFKTHGIFDVIYCDILCDLIKNNQSTKLERMLQIYNPDIGKKLDKYEIALINNIENIDVDMINTIFKYDLLNPYDSKSRSIIQLAGLARELEKYDIEEAILNECIANCSSNEYRRIKIYARYHGIKLIKKGNKVHHYIPFITYSVLLLFSFLNTITLPKKINY